MGLTGWYVSQTQEQTDGQELTVVTSFYPMYIAAENVIGDADGVRLENLSEPQTGCLHDFQLTPEDMKLLSTADVFIINGGGIESFMKEVAEAYPNLKIIEACENISPGRRTIHIIMRGKQKKNMPMGMSMPTHG